MAPIQNIIWCFEKIKSKCTLLTKFTQHLHWKSKREVQGRVSVENEVTERKKKIGHRWVLKEEDGKRKMWRIMKLKSWSRGDSNFILQSYCAFFFHFSLSFCWVFLTYSNLHHPTLKKLPKLPKKKKKRKHFVFRPGIHLSAETTGFRRYGASTAGIFSNTKHRGICTGLLADTVYTSRYGTELTSLVVTTSSTLGLSAFNQSSFTKAS